MTIPERTPLAVDHGLNTNRINALVQLLENGSTDAHHATLRSLVEREMIDYPEGSNRPYLTEHGKTVARGLLELDDTPEEAAEVEEEPAEIPPAPEDAETFTCPGEAERELAEYAEAVSGVPPLTAIFQVICRGRRSGEHSQLIAVVVGNESKAQMVADQWNLAHIADIAARPDATFAVAVPAEVGVYLFERFAVVEH